MQRERWRPVQKCINEFRRHLAVDFPPLRLEHIYDYGWDQNEYKDHLKRGVYRPGGVYLIYDADETLIYVGKTGCFHKRVFRHAVYSSKLRDASVIDAVVFDESRFHFASALEHLLIVRLQPRGNSHCRNDLIPPVCEETAARGPNISKT